ncbi:hypothetical protein LC087_11430 [Bacillus carboniphilus]|uniref:Lipoprotein n=1 Tax=Bacillus carboniphilus TaxID=86663 RepID=A0ABY9JQ45_9BACI|nr:hypothetical protein [Bacillus carboniphilus]WLR41501.1 hypothetical protein LC087_11430 [Bacillus carboniphilus]
MRKRLILLMTLTLLLTGCELIYKEEAEKYQQVGDEIETLDMEFTFNKASLERDLNINIPNNEVEFEIPNKDITIELDEDSITYYQVYNQNFNIGDVIKVGADINEVISHEEWTILYEYELSQAHSKVFFTKKDYKVILDIKEEIIDSIVIIQKNQPYAPYVLEKETDIEDEKLKFMSKGVNLQINYKKNNRGVVKDSFLNYAKIGLVEDIPVPVGAREYYVEKKLDEGFLLDDIGVYPSDSEYYMYYNHLNTYLGMNEGVLQEFIIPVEIKEEELLNVYTFKNRKMQLEEGLELSYQLEDEVVIYLIIKKIEE